MRRAGVDDLLQPRPAVAGQPRGARALPRGRSAPAGAVPAVTAVLDGVVRVGHRRVRARADPRPGAQGGRARPAGRRRLRRWHFGATTVSASVAIAALAGISVFATGGIGGVHRGAELTGDVSADLDALASRPVITVSAGAKAFLDLPRTLEYLETRGVPVLGWRHDDFPAFYTRSSGLRVPHRVEDGGGSRSASFAARTRAMTGILVAVPIPVDDELDAGRSSISRSPPRSAMRTRRHRRRRASRRSCSAGSPTRRRARAFLPTSRSPRTTPRSPPRSPWRWRRLLVRTRRSGW